MLREQGKCRWRRPFALTRLRGTRSRAARGERNAPDKEVFREEGSRTGAVCLCGRGARRRLRGDRHDKEQRRLIAPAASSAPTPSCAPGRAAQARHGPAARQARRTRSSQGAQARQARKRWRSPQRRSASPQLQAIAACESGGNPSAIGGGGAFRGKYQFDYGTWASVGGSGDPAAAPEAEQDAARSALLARSGTSPWPVCGTVGAEPQSSRRGSRSERRPALALLPPATRPLRPSTPARCRRGRSRPSAPTPCARRRSRGRAGRAWPPRPRPGTVGRLRVEPAPDADEGVVLPLVADRRRVGVARVDDGLGRQLHQHVHDRGLEVLEVGRPWRAHAADRALEERVAREDRLVVHAEVQHPGRVPGRVQAVDPQAAHLEDLARLDRAVDVHQLLGLERVGEDLDPERAPCRRGSPPRGRGGGGSAAGTGPSARAARPPRAAAPAGRPSRRSRRGRPARRRRGRRSRATPAASIFRRSRPGKIRGRGRRRLQGRVPRARAGGLPERGHRRPRAAARLRGGARPAAPTSSSRAASARPFFERPGRGRRSAARAAGALRSAASRRRRPHPLDHRRRVDGAVGPPARPRRRGADERRGAPRPARAARGGAAAARLRRALRAVRRASRRGRAADEARRLLARLVGGRPRRRPGGAASDRRPAAARRRAGPRRGAARRARARLRLLRRVRPEVAVRAGRQRLPVRAPRGGGDARPAVAELRVARPSRRGRPS